MVDKKKEKKKGYEAAAAYEGEKGPKFGGPPTRRKFPQAPQKWQLPIPGTGKRDPESGKVRFEQEEFSTKEAYERARRNAARQKAIESELKGGVFLEEKEFYEEEAPERVELDIEKAGAAIPLGVPGLAPAGPTGAGVFPLPEETPVLGPGAGARAAILRNAAVKGWLGKDFQERYSELEPLIQDPQTFREKALQEIQKEVIAEGISQGESFGAFIESIPIVGSAVGRYVGGLIEAPRANVETVIAEIKSERERASVLAEKIATGKFGDPKVAYGQILDIEENIIRLEARIQVLAATSAILRSDADAINKIEEEILRSKERVFMAKQAAAQGIIQISSDESLYLELQELKGGG